MIETTELAKYLGIEPDSPGLTQAITAAEATVIGELGIESLEAQDGLTHSTRLDLPTTRLHLPLGPATTLEALTVDGAAQTLTDYQILPWAVERIDGLGFALGSIIVVTYTIGWAHEGEMPQRIRQAVLQTAASIYGRSDPSITSSREGSESTGWSPGQVYENIHRLAGRWAAPTG